MIWVSGTYLLIKFEGVAKCVQTFRLFGVCVSERLRGGFEEVLVVAHLGYWHTVELVWTKERELHEHEWKVLHFLLSKRHVTPAVNILLVDLWKVVGELFVIFGCGYRRGTLMTKHDSELQNQTCIVTYLSPALLDYRRWC